MNAVTRKNAISHCLASIGRDAPDVIVAAHRGASSEAPENTLAALDLAIGYGVEAVEFDVRLTSDEQLVVIHDGRLGRTAPGSALISSLSVDELVVLDAGSWFGEFAGERIPSLRDALDMLRGRAVPIIDVKDPGERGAKAAKVLARAMIEDDIEESCVVVSSHQGNLRVVADMCPETPVGLVATTQAQADATIRSTGYDGSLIWWHSLERDLADVALERGDFVGAWTVPAERLAQVLESGANLIVTNQPREVLDQLGRGR